MLKKLENLIFFLSLGIVGGFCTGAISGSDIISQHYYFQYRLFRLIGLTISTSLFSGLFSATILSLSFFIILQISVFFSSYFLSFHPSLSAHRKKIGYISGVCIILVGTAAYFIYSRWLISHFLWSVCINLLLCFCVVRLGRMSFKLNWHKIFPVMRKRFRLMAILLFFIYLVLQASISFVHCTDNTNRPNVILLVVDALRADALGCYNNMSTDTPNIDVFAHQSILFKNAFSQGPCTINSSPSIFCSVYPYEHRYCNYKCKVSAKFNSMAELLRNEGYRTYAISSNPHVSSMSGLSQGFEIFQEDLIWKNTDCNEINERFINWAKNNRKTPFFAMLWYIDPHNPYDPPHDYVDRYVKKENHRLVNPVTKRYFKKNSFYSQDEKDITKQLYSAEVNFFDHEFGVLMRKMQALGLDKNSIIILTSDHGEAFWEQNFPWSHERIQGHGKFLYKEELKIPMIISLPGMKHSKVIERPAQHIDILPTVMHYVRGQDSCKKQLCYHGESLRYAIEGKDNGPKFIYQQLMVNNKVVHSLQVDDKKVICVRYHKKKCYRPPLYQFINLRTGEKFTKLSSKILDRVDYCRLRKCLDAWPGNVEKCFVPQNERGQKAEQQRILKRLKSLGYTQ